MKGLDFTFIFFIVEFSSLLAVIIYYCARRKLTSTIVFAFTDLVAILITFFTISVPSPEIYPLDGKIHRGESIRITSEADTNLLEHFLRIYYSTDVSIDPKNGLIYTEPFIIEDDTIVSAKAHIFGRWSNMSSLKIHLIDNEDDIPDPAQLSEAMDVSSKEDTLTNSHYSEEGFQSNGFVFNDFFYSENIEAYYNPDSGQRSIQVEIIGADVEGWTVTIMIPQSGLSAIVTNNYQGSVSFSISPGTYELQVFSNDGITETVYKSYVDLYEDGFYQVELGMPEMHDLQ